MGLTKKTSKLLGKDVNSACQRIKSAYYAPYERRD